MSNHKILKILYEFIEYFTNKGKNYKHSKNILSKCNYLIEFVNKSNQQMITIKDHIIDDIVQFIISLKKLVYRIKKLEGVTHVIKQ